MDDLKREILSLFEADSKYTLKAIYKALKVKAKDEKRMVRDAIRQLLEEGQLIRDGKGYYHSAESSNLVAGTIEFSRRGTIAFVTTDQGQEIAVPVEFTSSAMHGDKVLIEIVGKWRNLPMGKVTRVLKRGKEKIVGVFEVRRTRGFVIPDDPKIIYDFYVPIECINGAKPHQRVIARITKWPRKGKDPEACIETVLGNVDDPKTDVPAVMAKYDLTDRFPDEVLAELEQLPDDVRQEDIDGRMDLRDEIVFTIDGEDAKDFDDAVSIKKLPKGKYLLGVHIADVSHYVKENTALDKEAYRRGTSVYLLDTVVPMLPFKLSNNLCSLMEDKDRLTFTVEMIIDEEGRVLDFDVAPSVIRSKKRLTYTIVNRLLEGDQTIERALGKQITDSLKMMHELSLILRQARQKRGAITDIEGGEVEVVMDDKGQVVDIVPRKRGPAEILIEEFMIRANETVAEIFHNAGLPFVYRVHEEPDPETILQLKEYVEALGLKVKFPKTMHPSILQKVLELVRDHPLRSSVEKLMVRSMKRAMYSFTNIGHFGLASYAYTHFTSPIRRYPDLVVHRLLKLYLRQGNRFTEKQIEIYSKLLPKIAQHCSKRERIADEAEWDLLAMKKVEYISRHMDKIFDAVVTNVTRFGLFVEIPDKLISGLVHISTLDDYYFYDERKNILVGERTGRIFKIGDTLKVRVLRADKIAGEIDFELVGEEERVDKRVSRK
ncbi:ribonuclease R [Pseudothermotoga hypogea DSM 11164 = NBRC 106472]|uniref:Ribonuclease R n=1 Tax=Pseudothermotoga hypogea DSM 11164 = NBRC 106472 TaxID=1123384 RepID=A0A0X1KTE8_9THEM|nr:MULTISPECIES: ribonuclease R [Pseudothermotoga]AJC74554.1 ribonuclease R [Pseudothermotoga hypogea DSM 11164 = NBRC 106472]MDI6862132.1 ribonuclease R [Pseudothermotoga sp.]